MLKQTKSSQTVYGSTKKTEPTKNWTKNAVKLKNVYDDRGNTLFKNTSWLFQLWSMI
jgi:hypothetical protein